MRRTWLGLVGLTVLAVSCGGGSKPPPEESPTFQVGGTLSGLTGSVTLQLNNAEKLTRTENGPFTFATELYDLTPFTVTIAQQPQEQDCTLQGATGKMSGANVDSVKVTCAARTYTLGGTVEGLNAPLQLRLQSGETLSVNGSGPFTFQTRLPRGGTYAVSFVAQPKGHRCTLGNEGGTVSGNVTGISVRCTPWFDLATFQNATVVIGQSNFTSNLPRQGGAAGPGTLDGPIGSPVFVGGTLYVTDHKTNRILGFNAVPTQNGPSAAFVLGQPDFTSGIAGGGQVGFSHPKGLSSDGARFAVVDSDNSRILLFSTLPSSTSSQPNLVLGQQSFTTAVSACGASALSFPDDVSLSGGKVVVADTGNHRVLLWNSIPTVNGAPADVVLGQTSLTTCAENDANGDGTNDGAPTASTLSSPEGVWTDGTRLLVVDTNNNRVLFWNQFPTTNGQPADVVLGQADFSTRTEGTTATGMLAPGNVRSTGQQLFVVDRGNNRVLMWNQLPATNGAAADVVLGQQDFTSNTPGDPASGGTSARSLDQPSGILLAAPYLGIVDSGNNRVLLFESR